MLPPDDEPGSREGLELETRFADDSDAYDDPVQRRRRWPSVLFLCCMAAMLGSVSAIAWRTWGVTAWSIVGKGSIPTTGAPQPVDALTKQVAELNAAKLTMENTITLLQRQLAAAELELKQFRERRPDHPSWYSNPANLMLPVPPPTREVARPPKRKR